MKIIFTYVYAVTYVREKIRIKLELYSKLLPKKDPTMHIKNSTPEIYEHFSFQSFFLQLHLYFVFAPTHLEAHVK